MCAIINVPRFGVHFFVLSRGRQTTYLCITKGVIKSGGADMRVKITLACTECKQRNYVSKKNKKNDPDRIEMMKH